MEDRPHYNGSLTQEQLNLVYRNGGDPEEDREVGGNDCLTGMKRMEKRPWELASQLYSMGMRFDE